MSVSTSHNGPATAAGPDPARNNLRNIEKVRAIFSALAKYINAKTIYASNNPTVAHFAEAFREAFRSYFEDEKELLLAVEQYQLKWRDEVVYRNTEKVDSLAFLLYKDGIGEVTIHSSVKQEELDQLADLIKNEIYNPSAHLDIVGRLWQLQFTNIFYRVFDDSADGATGDGKGSGAESREGALHAGDHPEAPGGADDEPPGARSDGTLEPLYDYLLDIIEHTHPQA
ncbi:MAG: hypothetical protein HY770_05550, partial [Chitinivibrionia bacterium]|nr:hypothetical protein [Chitinivibrionia bacterium]